MTVWWCWKKETCTATPLEKINKQNKESGLLSEDSAHAPGTRHSGSSGTNRPGDDELHKTSPRIHVPIH